MEREAKNCEWEKGLERWCGLWRAENEKEEDLESEQEVGESEREPAAEKRDSERKSESK